MRKIQVLGPGCPECDRLAAHARMAAEELGVNAVVERITDMGAILRFDVLLTPALAIDGRLVAVGAGVEGRRQTDAARRGGIGGYFATSSSACLSRIFFASFCMASARSSCGGVV